MKKLVTCIAVAVTLFLLMQCPTSWGDEDQIVRKVHKCYQCNSFYDKGCADYFDNRTYPLIPCPANATMCRKIIQETYYEGHWDVRYIRQCAVLGEVGPYEGRWCKERLGTYRVKVKYCHCNNKDGCNAATTLTSSTLNYTVLMTLLALHLIVLGSCRRLRLL